MFFVALLQLSEKVSFSIETSLFVHLVLLLEIDQEVSISIKTLFEINFLFDKMNENCLLVQMNEVAQERAEMIMSENKFQGGDPAFGENLLITNSRIVRR